MNNKKTITTLFIIIVILVLIFLVYRSLKLFGKKSNESNIDFSIMTKQELIDWIVKNAGLNASQLENKTKIELVEIANKV